MRRVRETIAPSQDFLPSPVSWDSGFREVDFGDWTGLGWDDVLQRFGVSAYDWLAVIEAGAVPGGESHAEIRDRVLVALRPFLDRWSGRTVALFAHGGIIRVILAWLLEIPLPLTTHLDIDYASVTRVHLNVPKGDVTRHEIHLLNFAPWRDLPAHR
jgi:broad specificity phosphatase PhoE